MTPPAWLTELKEPVRQTGLPLALLADAMRARGEDPRDEALWHQRIGQLDVVLFGHTIRGWRPDDDTQGGAL